jgi:hypothetical protein
VHEAGQPAAADDAERGEAGIDQFAGGLHDVAQHCVEIIGAGDRQLGAQQSPQPALIVLHVARPRHQLIEQLVQLKPGDLDKHDANGGVIGRPCGTGIPLAAIDILPHVIAASDSRHVRRRPRDHRLSPAPAGGPWLKPETPSLGRGWWFPWRASSLNFRIQLERTHVRA